MSVINKLASSLDRRDEGPNQELAKEIVAAQDKNAIGELVLNLSNKKEIQNDCIKVLYEVGYEAPQLIADYIDEFVNYLTSKNNRLQWGAMTALTTVTSSHPKEIYSHLSAILEASKKGSTITKDAAVNILIQLCQFGEYSESAFSLLMEELLKSQTNQLPMYAERALPIIDVKNKAVFVKVLSSRLDEVEKESKRKRIEKVIRKLK